MVIKLTPARPDDRYVRMYYSLVEKGDDASRWYEVDIKPEEQADENTGWIEFWADDARACKDALKRIAGRLYVLGERRDKRKTELSDEKAYDELQEYMRLIGEGLAYRTKAWRLVDSSGKELDAPMTFENAKAVYSDEDHDLREKAQEFLKDRRNFPLRASGN